MLIDLKDRFLSNDNPEKKDIISDSNEEQKNILPNINQKESKKLIDRIVSKVEGLILYEAKNSFENTLLTCTNEEFNSLLEQLIAYGFDIDKRYGDIYEIRKIRKNTNGTVISLLMKFKFEETKKET